jgi:uncharacterized protein (DUF2249 family)
MASTPDYTATALDAVDVPPDAAVETLDVRDLGPPEPLKETLERLVDCDDGTVLVQVNDRAPRHLYPKLTDRGYEYETIDVAVGFRLLPRFLVAQVPTTLAVVADQYLVPSKELARFGEVPGNELVEVVELVALVPADRRDVHACRYWPLLLALLPNMFDSEGVPGRSSGWGGRALGSRFTLVIKIRGNCYRSSCTSTTSARTRWTGTRRVCTTAR